MSYKPSGLTPLRAVLLMGWSFGVLFGVAAALFVFTYGDCYEDACRGIANRNFFMIVGLGFAIYWAGIFVLVRRWSNQ